MKKTDKENKEVTELKNQIEVLTNNWKRALADYQNLERRCDKERAEFLEYANGSLILRVLFVLDHLEKVQEYLKDDGLELAIKELKKVFTEEGLEEIEAEGKIFNPQEMEAVEAVEGEEEGRVAEVLTKGYSLRKKVIRPAKVKVTREVSKVSEVSKEEE